MKAARLPRIVLDTNVAVSAFLWGGKPAELIVLAGVGKIELFASRALINELAKTLNKPKLLPALQRRGMQSAQLVERYKAVCGLVRPKSLVPLSRDPDDDHVIACAIAAKADFIVTGDGDLLVLEVAAGVRILRVTDMLTKLV